MAYNKTWDKCLYESSMNADGDTKIVVGVYSYDGGPKKVGMTRTYEKKDGTTGYARLGRISLEELPELVKILSEIDEKEA